MIRVSRHWGQLFSVFVWAAILLGLYLTSLYSYLLFHSLVEIFGMVVAGAMFMVFWNARHLLDDGYFLYLGIAYLFVALVDLIHTLAYKGMGVFAGYDANLPTQLWILARYLESASLLVALLFVGRRLNPYPVLIAYTAVLALAFVAIFAWCLFPVCYVEGVGLTPFKKISEYVISLILAVGIVVLFGRRRAFDRDVLRLLVVSVLLTIGSELAFTFYVGVYDLSNLAGHILKVISFYLIYQALVRMSLVKPLDLMFANLARSEARLQRAQAVGHVGSWEYDIAGAQFWGSDETRRIYGFDPDDQGFSVERVEGCIPERERVHQALVDLIERDVKYELEFEIHPIDRREAVVIRSVAELVRGKNGDPFRVVGTIQDITAQKRAAQAILQLNAELEQRVAERTQELKSAQETLLRKEKLAIFGQMAGSVGHELRNPLGVISNARYILNMSLSDADEITRECLDVIQSEIQKSERIVGDLLDFARIPRRVQRTRVDAAPLVAEVLARVERPENVELAVHIPPDLPAVLADAQHIGQVLTNLVTNAYQAMPEGGRLTIDARTSQDQVAVSVTDTGVGIAEEDLPRLFEPLFTTKPRGTGLGLAISKNLVEANGGTITVQSEGVADQGSTFTLTLPLDRSGTGETGP
jgi:signal transduction histidine kinase